MLNMLIHYVNRLQVYQPDSALNIIQVSKLFLFYIDQKSKTYFFLIGPM